MWCILSFVLVFLASTVSCSSKCDKYEFQCEDGECIAKPLWCDSNEDCFDESDEKFCKKNSIWSKNPNNCPETYFKCNDGPCIPLIGRCDGYSSCDDSSDEKDCPSQNSSSGISIASTKTTTLSSERTTKATTSRTTRTTPQQPFVKNVSRSTNFSSSPGTVQHSVEIVYSDFQHSEYSSQREAARKWIISKRNSDFGWGDETPRALTALYLSDQRSINRNEQDVLMVKQLEVQLSVDMSRNTTKQMKQTDIALYINALLASCKDPKNFYGENLVRTLRNSVDNSHRGSTFVNPSVYLTLCLANETTYDDARRLHDVLFSRDLVIGRIDIQALAFLTVTCIYRNTNYLTADQSDAFKRSFLQKMNAVGIPGNVYEVSLLAQALQELKVTLPGLLDFLLKQQEEDGSFGGILATYLALPVLAGRSFLQIDQHCGQRISTDLAPIEVLRNTKRRRIHVRYSLNYGYTPEITESIQMQVAEGINFLDVMRLAEEINPKYRFMLDGNRKIPAVYSIGGIPNDAEKGTFWTLHLVTKGRLNAETRSIKELIPHPGDEFVFWMKSI